nr:hypothetical protein [Tanacetum cinerariifolium]
DLLSLQKAKRKNPMEQYILQRRIFEPTGSSFHDESPYDVLRQSDSEEESKKVLTGASEGGNDDVQTGPDPDPSISSSVASTQPAPTSAPAKSQENKRKQDTETTDKPVKAKRIKHSISSKTRQPRRSPKSVGTSEAEEVPAEEPWVTDEEADYQKAVEESLKTAHAVHQGPLPPVVIREPESGKYQPPLEVPGKGKAKVTEEQSSRGITGNEEQSIPNPVVHAGSDREHIDLDVTKALPQPFTEQLDEGFLSTAYPKIQESLKLAVEEQPLQATTTETTMTITTTTHPPPPQPQQASGGEVRQLRIMSVHIRESRYTSAGEQSDLQMDDDMAPDEQVHSSNDEDIENAHIPKVNLQQEWWKPLEEDIPVTPEPAWSIPSSNMHVPMNNRASALASTYTPPP